MRRWDSPETANFTNLAAYDASLDLILGIGIDAVARHVDELTCKITECLPRDRCVLASPEELLAEADDTLRQWAETAETAFREGADIAEALSTRFDAALRGVDPAHREKLETLNGVHSNAAGFRRWLEGRQAAS